VTDNIGEQVAGTEGLDKGILKIRDYVVLKINGEPHSFPIKYNPESLRWYQGKHREAYEAIMNDGQSIEQRKEVIRNYRAYCREERHLKSEIRERKAWNWWV